MSLFGDAQPGYSGDSSMLQSQPPVNSLQPPCSSQELSSETCVDPNGDLCIQVGEDPGNTFRVCSKTLARSSSFWNALLYGYFGESKKPCRDSNNEWTVKLPEDNPDAMIVVFYIIHGCFALVPNYYGSRDARRLYEVCIITEKYDMTRHQSLRERHCHELVWIAWELGDTATFESATRSLLLDGIDSAGDDTNSIRCPGILEPPEIYRIIEKARLKTIGALLAPLNDIIQRLVLGDRTLCRNQSEKERDSCVASMLGVGIQSLQAIGFWPIPRREDISWSVSALSRKLLDVKIENNLSSITVGNYNFTHSQTCINSIPSLLTEVHHRHLTSQAKKSGFLPTRWQTGACAFVSRRMVLQENCVMETTEMKP
ncbi:hypothetical protein GGR58DRAFT_526097 [Xylaria digitata]|nr:hypothetical protein GGR58DRAFT_526097 [Xylaria digitata]